MAGIRYHFTERGETLTKIALRYYGDGTLIDPIIKHNTHYLENPNLIQPGLRLAIPYLHPVMDALDALEDALGM